MVFSNLNATCPKEIYHFQKLIMLLDGAIDYELLSFMDTYSEYNQIMMTKEDEEKTTFVTDRGVYCYRSVMPFGLKMLGQLTNS